ncbi:MAG: hypothetical protein PGN07_03355 [Aeromicrobium erythreum]
MSASTSTRPANAPVAYRALDDARRPHGSFGLDQCSIEQSLLWTLRSRP